MKSIHACAPFLLVSLLAPLLLAAAPGGGDPCPERGACHLPRWVPDDLSAGADYGLAVDIQGNTAVVGAPEDDAVYVYHRDGGQWAQVQRLSIPGASGTGFGEALRLDGEELLIGAPLTDVQDNGITYFRAGTAYVFERSGLAWSLSETLLFSFPTKYARFGSAVDKDGDRIAVGSLNAWFNDMGTIVIFDRDVGGWAETTWLDGPASVGLGQSVAIDGNRVLGGDNVNDVLGDYAGRVYAWEDTGAGWSAAEILPSPGIGGGAFLGFSLDAEDGWVAAGAYGAGGTGQVLLYRHDAGTGSYEYVNTLSPCGGEAGSNFGHSVDLDAERLVVGSSLQGWPGTPSGRAHVYSLETVPSESWELEVVVAPGDGADWDVFGRGAAVDGDFVLVGASKAEGAGAAYLVSLQGESAPGGECPCDVLATAEPFGIGKPGSFGLPALALLSPPVVGEGAVVRLSNALPGAPVFLAWGLAPAVIPFDGGELYMADPQLIALPAVSGAGTSDAVTTVPADVAFCGLEFVVQAFVLDPGAGGVYGTAQSNGVRVILGY